MGFVKFVRWGFDLIELLSLSLRRGGVKNRKKGVFHPVNDLLSLIRWREMGGPGQDNSFKPPVF